MICLECQLQYAGDHICFIRWRQIQESARIVANKYDEIHLLGNRYNNLDDEEMIPLLRDRDHYRRRKPTTEVPGWRLFYGVDFMDPVKFGDIKVCKDLNPVEVHTTDFHALIHEEMYMGRWELKYGDPEASRMRADRLGSRLNSFLTITSEVVTKSTNEEQRLAAQTNIVTDLETKVATLVASDPKFLKGSADDYFIATTEVFDYGYWYMKASLYRILPMIQHLTNLQDLRRKIVDFVSTKAS